MSDKYCIYQCPICKRFTYGKCGLKNKICPYCNKRFKPGGPFAGPFSAEEAREKVREFNRLYSREINLGVTFE